MLRRIESLLCTFLVGRMEGTRTCRRQSDTMVDWMKSNDVEYDHIKKRAYDREDWHHWRPEPAWKGRALRRDCTITATLSFCVKLRAQQETQLNWTKLEATVELNWVGLSFQCATGFSDQYSVVTQVSSGMSKFFCGKTFEDCWTGTLTGLARHPSISIWAHRYCTMCRLVQAVSNLPVNIDWKYNFAASQYLLTDLHCV